MLCKPLTVTVVADSTPTLTITPSTFCEGDSVHVHGNVPLDACADSSYFTIAPDPHHMGHFTFYPLNLPPTPSFIYNGPLCPNDSYGQFNMNNPANPLNIPDGTYTLTLHDRTPCGTDSVSRVFTMNALLPSFTVSLDCSNNATIKYNGFCPDAYRIDRNYIFTWNLGDGTIITDTASPFIAPHYYTMPGIYTIILTVTNLNCGDQASFSQPLLIGAPTCCPTGVGGTIITGPAFSYTEPNPLTGAGPSTIKGNFFINSNYTIKGANVAMFTDARIEVLTGATLTIDSSRLYACDSMWQGIQVDEGGTLIVKKRSIVEDALQAIKMRMTIGGYVSVENSTLNNNLYDVVVSPPFIDQQAYILSISKSTLSTSIDPGFSNNPYLKPPFAPGILTHIGVYLNNIGGGSMIQIGDTASAATRNTFSNMEYGVYAVNSSFEVFNNKFENLKGSPICPPPVSTGGSTCVPTGIAVYAATQQYIDENQHYYQAVVGGTGGNHWNKMKNCYRGVDITNYAYPFVSNNRMTNTTNIVPYLQLYSPYGDHGVFVKSSVQPLVTYNHIQNFLTGIHVNGFVDDGSCYPPNPYAGTGSSLISENDINADNSGVMNNGIISENNVPVGIICFDSSRLGHYYSHPFTISNNTVSDARFACVYLNNVSADSSFVPTYVVIANNTLNIYPSTQSTDKAQRTGVLLTGDKGQIGVYDNAISGQNTKLLPNYGSNADTSVVGVRSILSSSATGFGIVCNTIEKVGQCLRWEGSCSPTFAYRNQLYKCHDGWVLWNSATLGQQGTTTQPIGDEWHGPILNSWTFANSSDATQSPIWVLNNALQDPGLAPSHNQCGLNCLNDYNVSGAINLATGNVAACPCPNCAPPPCPNCNRNPHRVQKELRMVIHDSVTYNVYAQQSAYLAKQNVLMQLTADTTLLAGDTALQSFYNNAPATSMGKVNKIALLIAYDSVSAATSMNNALAPANNIEVNYQTAYGIYLHTLALNKDSIDSLQYIQLNNIAQQCPVEGGKAVFLARAMLNRLLNTNIIYPDNCSQANDSNNRHRADSHKTEGVNNMGTPNSNINLYPNPNSGDMSLSYNLNSGENAILAIYDVLGKEIYNTVLPPSQTILTVHINLSDGVYLYSVSTNERGTLKTGKVVVIK